MTQIEYEEELHKKDVQIAVLEERNRRCTSELRAAIVYAWGFIATTGFCLIYIVFNAS